VLEEFSEGGFMRAEIAYLAGPRSWGDTRASWLNRVPKVVKRALGTEKETVPYRTVKALWYGEIRDGEHHAVRDVKRAVELVKAREEAKALAESYQTLIGGMSAADSDFFREDIARLERVARLLCGQDRK
jgi:hypothetical protein